MRDGRRKAARYIVPIAVAGVAAATIGLVPALASSGDPDLPKISAQELIEKIAASDTEQLSGNVKISTDLGLPSFAGLADLGDLAGGGKDGGDGKGATADPQSKLLELATGTHHLQVAADGPDKQKVTILGKGSDYSLIHNGDDVWAYDSGTKEAVHTKGDAGEGHEAEPTATPKELAEQALKAADPTTKVTVDGTSRIAGQDAYQLKLEPKQSGSTISSITIDVDADTYVPLKFALNSTDGGKPVVDAGFTKIDFSKPDASNFALPKGAKVTEGEDLEKQAPKDLPKDLPKDVEKDLKDLEKEFGKEGMPAEGDLGGMNVIGEGWSTIATFDTGGQGMPDEGEMKDMPAGVGGLLDSFGDKVSGEFGEGTVFKTRLINVLMTDDGKVYAGAVTKDALVKAANEAK
ncbi:outer membrane lipoprotein carrier protein LolA [Streptomyces sp. TRM66268-LWL]|uniref:Outer membrane lipoprotein carrier protein LolA n=1 Tax=Streptomyces polyasparticus TaxID=2767826 RepID=A0ABR7SSX9_9ACTN|nr:outer membrane lipoprotein carrier protein LolA [Streptomyces polyasparticus]